MWCLLSSCALILVLSLLRESYGSDVGERCGTETCGHRATCQDGRCECDGGGYKRTIPRANVIYCIKQCPSSDAVCPAGTSCVKSAFGTFVCMCLRGYQLTPYGACEGTTTTTTVSPKATTDRLTVTTTTTTVSPQATTDRLTVTTTTTTVSPQVITDRLTGMQNTPTNHRMVESTSSIQADKPAADTSFAAGLGVGAGIIGGVVLIEIAVAVVVFIRRVYVRGNKAESPCNNPGVPSERDLNYESITIPTDGSGTTYTHMSYDGQPRQHNNPNLADDRDRTYQSITDRTDDNSTPYTQMSYDRQQGQRSRREEFPSTLQTVDKDYVNVAPSQDMGLPEYSNVSTKKTGL